MKAQIRFNKGKEKYELVAKGKVLVTSKTDSYLVYLVNQQKHSAILKANVTEVEVVSHKPNNGIQISGPDTLPEPEIIMPVYGINERFEFMEQLIDMVIDGSATSLLVSGEGGVGKTYTVMDSLTRHGKVNCNTVMPTIEDLITPDDEEDTIEAKALAQINAFQGDYTVVKGHSSAKALYRLLYENRNRTLIFDDCDSALKDGTSLQLLKAALDSYEDRWVSWRIDADMDLPSAFKFNGSIIFISNMPLSKIDEAVRTRCFKVDLSMTKPQRIERMRSVLEHVMPEVDMEFKTDALNLLEENLSLTDDINFRSLMHLISIRTSNVKDWKRLGVYSLTEQ